MNKNYNSVFNDAESTLIVFLPPNSHYHKAKKSHYYIF